MDRSIGRRIASGLRSVDFSPAVNFWPEEAISVVLDPSVGREYAPRRAWRESSQTKAYLSSIINAKEYRDYAQRWFDRPLLQNVPSPC